MNSTCLGSLYSNAIKQYINLWKKEENQGRRGESNTDLTQVTYKRHHKGRRSQMLTWHKSLTNIITKGGGVKHWPGTSHLQTSSQREGESNADLTQVTYKRHHKGRGGQMLTWHKSLTSQKVISSSPQTDKR